MYYKNYERIRSAAGMTDSQVSEATGIPRMNFSDWKHDRTTPKVANMKKIADTLGVTVDELIKEP